MFNRAVLLHLPPDIANITYDYLDDNKLNVVIVMPPQAKKTQADGGEREAAGDVRRVVLDNGLTVVLMEQHEVPLIDLRVIIGGGAMVEELLSALNLSSQKIDGLRVTPKEHMPYITGALAGTANK